MNTPLSLLQTFEQCALDQSLKSLVAPNSPRLVLIAGAMGHGKSTTLRALVHEAVKEHNLRVIQLFSNANNVSMNVPTITKPAPLYRKPLDFHDMDKIAGARRNSLQTVSKLLETEPDLVVIDDLNDPEMAHIAGRLVECGLTVFASIHSPDSNVIERFHNILHPFNKARMALEFPMLNYTIVYQMLVKDEKGKVTPKVSQENGIS